MNMVLKQSKLHLFLLVTLGVMIFGQTGSVLFNGPYLHWSGERTLEKGFVQGGSAKAFGLALPKEKHFQVTSVKELDCVFQSCGYTLTKAKNDGTVPRLYLAKFPQDMQRKKKASNPTFIQVLLPHILKVNELILADRTRLLEMQARQKKGRHLHYADKLWLKTLAADYRCKSTKIDALLAHVDIVPPSLALAQGIIETGGGRSQAARKKNSPFGHMATKTKVQKFASLYHSVEAYARNLNRHSAYASFRKARATLRTQKLKLCGHALAPHLTKYSIRKAAYTKDLQHLIHTLELKGYDTMVLDQKNVRLKP
jgi:Bax protein